jgi:hypothetical protein
MSVFSFLKDKVIGEVGNVVDNVFTNDEEKSEAKKQLTEVVMKGLNDVAAVQGEVIKTEMTGNRLQRSWRPIMMLTFGAILVCKWFGWTDASIPDELELKLMDIIELGLGGFVIGRTVEKTATAVTKNVDMSFLKKKDRKLAD